MAKLYGIGVGVGDPEMLTVKAVKALKESDIVLLPRARTKSSSTAYEIAKSYLRDDIEKVYVDFATVDDDQLREEDRKAYAEVVNRIIEEDKTLAFITIGDPMTLSTFVYVMELLDQDIEVESIPGITSFASICSRLNTPLLMGDERMKVVPLHKDSDISAEVDSAENIVFMKISRNLDELISVLREKGLLDKAVLISNCGKADEKIFYDLSSVRRENISYFSTVLLKKSGVVQWRKFTNL
ncbi:MULTISPECIES: precorrin-2 C(20)-methyltransferase [unclassified Oceanispirochaeta]|uniref:precorrin-2 C(20)-methyltransferase n=1 Tax=unclassified Oceanispirochaeta TaxID=2635722 RepID=UPI000E0944F4|nr:precorrin-2 C(20)-methyltransferase [Oceanispirochaeta sp. M1]MBF9016950.1 precorrin-2 C(20)-methyltransferase [Oceanispirochaeta sp. M2]NPD73313.1 precorrin-2 C(20)-methyltransferase [Oceanispirochaeta sp. M1]RDG30975.1 precorrin-2 C(20)-methyltransferase [Oceanispirochaeta sp. M1]